MLSLVFALKNTHSYSKKWCPFKNVSNIKTKSFEKNSDRNIHKSTSKTTWTRSAFL